MHLSAVMFDNLQTTHWYGNTSAICTKEDNFYDCLLFSTLRSSEKKVSVLGGKKLLLSSKWIFFKADRYDQGRQNILARLPLTNVSYTLLL